MVCEFIREKLKAVIPKLADEVTFQCQCDIKRCPL